MKFELEPYRRNIPDGTFLEDLKEVARQLRKKSVTMEEYKKYGAYHPSSIYNRFGSWFTALEKAGLEKARSEINIPIENCVADLKRVAQKLGKETITQKEYSEHGQYSPNTLIRRFGSWGAALEQNGLKRTRNYRVSEEEYFENLEYIWRTLGRQPRYSDMQKPFSKYSGKAYEQKFGTWRKALEAFIDYVNREAGVVNEPDQNDQQQSACFASGGLAANNTSRTKQKTSRAISWRLRFLVMRHDNFRCRLCGAVQNVDKNIRLDVDHIVPWSAGGETIMENLQTLCNRCNNGKSNLSMHEEKG